MSLKLDLYTKRLNSYMVDNKNGQIELIKKQISDRFQSNPSYFQVLINGVETDVHIVDENYLTNGNYRKRILCEPNSSIVIGDIVEWESEKWICINTDIDNQVQDKGIICKCNNTLTFQDTNFNTYSYPCIIQDKTSSTSEGLDVNKFISLADDQILVTVPNNVDIQKLRVDKRIMFNNDSNNIYKITRIQDLVEENLVYITMQKDEYNSSSDRTDLNLCDYKEEVTNPSMDIEIIGSNTIKLNQTLTYTVDYPEIVMFELTDTNSDVVSDIADFVDINGNECTIQGSGDSSFIGQQFRLYAKYDDGTTVTEGYLEIKLISPF